MNNLLIYKSLKHLSNKNVSQQIINLWVPIVSHSDKSYTTYRMGISAFDSKKQLRSILTEYRFPINNNNKFSWKCLTTNLYRNGIPYDNTHCGCDSQQLLLKVYHLNNGILQFRCNKRVVSKLEQLQNFILMLIPCSNIRCELKLKKLSCNHRDIGAKTWFIPSQTVKR